MGMPTIFISYRREDSIGHAGRLFDRLAERFGRDRVYRDIDAIEAGEDFVAAIRQQVDKSDVLLALIGPRWLTAKDAEGRSRLADENDLVRLEIATALNRNIRVVPVLLQGATMPGSRDLPTELARLAQRNAVEIRDTHFDQDLAQLLDTLAPRWRHTVWGVLRRRPVYGAAAGLLVAALVAALYLPGVTLTPEQARVKIERMGVPYTADAFLEQAKSDDAVARQIVHLFLKAGMNPNTKNREGQTALQSAAAEGRVPIVKVLLDYGADVNPALPWAASRGQAEALGLMMGKRPSQDAVKKALLAAAGSGQTRIVETLLDRGVDVNANHEGDTPLMSAAEDKHPETVRLLLSRGAEVNLKRAKTGWTALHSAAHEESGHNRDPEGEIVRLLLDRGAEVNARSKYVNSAGDWTPLMLAIDSKRPKVALLLIEAGADVNAQSEYYFLSRASTTAIMLAARKGLSEIVPALLAKGAEVNARNSVGATNLIVAAGQNSAIAQTLLANGAEVNATSDAGRTALMEAAGGASSILQALLGKGAVVNARDKDGETALMGAAWMDAIENVRVLLANGAQVNAARKDGWTALMLAAHQGWARTVRLLVDRGADVNARNEEGQTALMLAREEGQQSTVEVLTKKSGAVARQRR
jgi:ankyrin repeat protein